jgi:hypothetical protein
MKYTVKNDDIVCDTDTATWVIIFILIIAIIYYLMNMYSGKGRVNSKISWIIIIALVVSAVYLLVS